jgi:Spy/CpxP family protein refolding chaperone
MLGFAIGTACLIGLITMIRRGRHARWGGHFGRRGWGRRGPLNRLFSRLETSTSQEKLILSAVEEVELAVRGVRPELESTRADLSRLLAEESFDAERLNAVYARHDDAIREVRNAMTSALSKVHGALDSTQRAELSRLIEWRVFRRFDGGMGGPYRQAAVHI